MSQELTLPWGKEKLTLSLPDHWKIIGNYEPASLPPVADPAAQVKRSLQQPIGSARLAERLRPGMKITVVIDDISRPTPVSLIYHLVFEEIHQAGISAESITILPAIGLHRGMTEQEIRERAGINPNIPLQFVNPDCDDL